jgi:uracil-DNA glycosylase
MRDATELMKEIQDDILGLTSSPLYEYRTINNYFPVIGQGSLTSNIVFIGEAPGKNEALTGKPFCGAAGRILDELLTSIGLDREDIYITNIVKDRPPENRDPTPEEISLYGPFLDKQLEIIQPKILATLGRHSMIYIMKRYGLDDKIKPISQTHGKLFKATATFGNVAILPLYHPAVALYNGNQKKILMEDMKILKKTL